MKLSMNNNSFDKVLKPSIIQKSITKVLISISNTFFNPSINKKPLFISKTEIPLFVRFDGTTRWFYSLKTLWNPHVALSEASDFIWMKQNLRNLTSWEIIEITKENVSKMTEHLIQEYNKRYEFKSPNIDLFSKENQHLRPIAIFIEDKSVIESISHENNFELYKILKVGRSLGFCFFVKKPNIPYHPVSVSIYNQINKGYFRQDGENFTKLDDNIGKEYQMVINKIKDSEVINLYSLEISEPKSKSLFTDSSGMAYYQCFNNISCFVEVLKKDSEGNLIVRDPLSEKIGIIPSNKIQYLYKANLRKVGS